MANKVTAEDFKKIAKLLDIGLTHKVIATRMGISERTVRVYARAIRTGTSPYELPNVSPRDSVEEAV